MNNITIRKFNPEDLSEIVKIEKETFGEQAFSKDVFIQLGLSNPEGFFVALNEEKKIVGYLASVLTINSKNAWGFSIGIKNEYQNIGISKGLINYAIEYAENFNLDSVEFSVLKQNSIAIKLFNSLGFSKKVQNSDSNFGDREIWKFDFTNKNKEDSTYFDESSISISFVSVLFGVSALIFSFLLTNNNELKEIYSLSTLAIILLTSFYSALFYANYSGVVRLNSNTHKPILIGNILSEYFGVYLITIVIPLLIAEMYSNQIATFVILGLSVILFNIYQFSGFSILFRYIKGKFIYLFINLIFILLTITFIISILFNWNLLSILCSSAIFIYLMILSIYTFKKGIK